MWGALVLWLLILLAGVFAVLIRRRQERPPSWARRVSTWLLYLALILFLAFIIGFLFLGTLKPPPPFAACGQDPTDDRLSCESAGACR